MFENKKIKSIHATQYIASWLRAGGEFRCLNDYWCFERWLRSLGIQDDDVQYISNLAQNGKLELQMSVEQFLANSQ